MQKELLDNWENLNMGDLRLRYLAIFVNFIRRNDGIENILIF